MGNNARKAEEERKRFGRFVQTAGLIVVPGSIESREPSEPDILCSIEGHGPVAFELVEWVDAPFAEMESLALRGRDPGAISYGKSFIECIRPKLLDRNYSSPHPMELVVWGGESEFELATPINPSVRDLAQQLLDRSVFQHLWVVRLSRAKGDVLWLSTQQSPEPRG